MTFPIPPGARVWIGGHDPAARRVAEACLKGAVRPPTGPIDAVVIVPRTTDEAVHFAQKLRRRLEPNGCIWVVRPAHAGSGTPDAGVGLDNVTESMVKSGFVAADSIRLGTEHVALRFDRPNTEVQA